LTTVTVYYNKTQTKKKEGGAHKTKQTRTDRQKIFKKVI